MPRPQALTLPALLALSCTSPEAPREDTECPTVCSMITPQDRLVEEELLLDWSEMDRDLRGNPTSPSDAAWLSFLYVMGGSSEWPCEGGLLETIPYSEVLALYRETEAALTLDADLLESGYIMALLADESYPEGGDIQALWEALLAYSVISPSESGSADPIALGFPEGYPEECL